MKSLGYSHFLNSNNVSFGIIGVQTSNGMTLQYLSYYVWTLAGGEYYWIICFKPKLDFVVCVLFYL